MTPFEEKKIFRQRMSRVIFAAAIIFLLTALFLDGKGAISEQQTLPGSGGTVGPVKVTEPNTVVKIDVTQNISTNSAWSFVTGELLDANREYLTGFGDEFYYETGYDSEGGWTEQEKDFDNKLTIQKPGEYFFNFNVESNIGLDVLPDMRVRIESKVGSSIPHFAGGMLLLIGSVLLNYFSGGILRSLF